MMHCRDLQHLWAPYVDGEAGEADAFVVERHLRRCPACEQRLAAERAARAAVHHERPALLDGCASPDLKARCARLACESRERRGRGLVRVAAAAAAVLAVAAGLLYVLTQQSTTVLAAQLTADHLKCFLSAHHHEAFEAGDAHERLKTRYGLDARVPPGQPESNLRLIDARRCLTVAGTNAHVLYSLNGRPVSLYLLPADARLAGSVRLFGHEARTWSGHNGTYVLVANEPPAELERLAAYMQQATQ
jgi:anti-sigma factor RsiW